LSLLRSTGIEGKQLTDWHPQPGSKGADAGQGWIADAPLNTRQISDVDAGAISHVFLGFVPVEPNLPYMTAEGDLVTHHGWEVE
jgi:hypothetical protein